MCSSDLFPSHDSGGSFSYNFTDNAFVAVNLVHGLSYFDVSLEKGFNFESDSVASGDEMYFYVCPSCYDFIGVASSSSSVDFTPLETYISNAVTGLHSHIDGVQSSVSSVESTIVAHSDTLKDSLVSLIDADSNAIKSLINGRFDTLGPVS